LTLETIGWGRAETGFGMGEERGEVAVVEGWKGEEGLET
jgi:hypothetical protein